MIVARLVFSSILASLVGAPFVTAVGYTRGTPERPRANPFSLTPQASDFPSGNSLTTVGASTALSLNPGGAYDNTYTVHFFASITNTPLTLAIDVNDGSGWVETSTFNYANCGGTSQFPHEQRSVVVSGLGVNDSVRLRVKSAPPCGGGSTFLVRGGDGAGSNIETYRGVTYSTDGVAITWPQWQDFESGNVIDAVGDSAEVELDPGLAYDNTYTVHFYVTLNNVPLTLAVDANDGSGWVEKTTFNYANCGGTSQWLHEQQSVVVNGLKKGDRIRLRAKSAPPCSGPPNTFLVRVGDGAGVNPETYHGLTYNTSSVLVTPHGEPVVVPAGTGVPQPFSVANLDSVSRIYNITASCSGAATSCTAAPSQITVAGRTSGTATATYNVAGTVGTAGTITVRATLQGTPAVSDSGWGKLTVAPAGPVVTRNQCLTIAAAPAAAYECGDLRLTHALPGVRTFNAPRGPTLLYNSQFAHPYPLFQADVTAPASLPDSIRATLTFNNQNTIRTWPGSAWGSGGQTRRVVVGYDAASLATGLYDYQLVITKFVGGSGTTLQTTTGSMTVVNRATSPFGPGWWLAGYERLYFNVPAGKVLWVGGDGSVRQYERTGTKGTDTVYLAPPQVRPDTLLHTNGNQWVRLLSRGGTVTFTSNGIHRRTTTRLGYRTEFYPDSLGDWKLLRIQLSPDTTLTYDFAYTGTPPVISTTSVRGVTQTRVTAFTWTADSLRVKDLNGTVDSSVVLFTYQTGGTNRILARRDRRRTFTTFTYDAGYRLASSRLGVPGADSVIRSFCGADVRGLAACSPALVAPDSAYTRFDGPRLPADSADVTDFWLNGFGAPSKVRDAYGKITTLASADPRWPALVTRVQSPSGRIMSAGYDARGNVAIVADSNPYNTGQHPTTRYAWDQRWDQVTQIILPNGQLTKYSVNASNGNLLWAQDGRGLVSRTSFQYYTSGNGTGLVSTVIPPIGAPTNITYDPRGNAASLEVGGWTTFFQTDQIGRTTVVRTPIGSGQYRNDTTAFDNADRPVRMSTYAPAIGSGPAGLVTTLNYYDEESNLFKMRRAQSPNPTSLDTLTTQWLFDVANRAIVEIAPDGYRDSVWFNAAGLVDSTRDRNGRRTAMVYDRMNRPKRRIVPAVTYPQQQSPGTMAQLDLWQDSVTGPHPYPWFPNNGSGYTVSGDTAVFAYDSAGNLMRADNRDARVRRSYWKTGQLAIDTLVIRPLTGWDSTQHRYVVSYGYDVNGRLRALRHPSQLLAGTGLRDSVTYAYNDTTGALTRVAGLAGQDTTKFLYDVLGETIRTDLPGGIYDSLGYDLIGRVTFNRIRNASTSPYKDPGTYLRQTTLQYSDPVHVISATNVVGWKDTVNASYSGLGHLLSLSYARPANSAWGPITRDATVETFRFDPLGNVDTSSTVITEGQDMGGIGGYWSDTHWTNGHIFFDHVTGRVQSSNDASGTFGFLYDSAGNSRFTYQNPGGNSSLMDNVSYYGGDGRLHAAESRGAFTTNPGDWRFPGWQVTFEEYRYDALGRRVFVWDRRDCHISDVGGYQPCQQGRVRRTVWDGQRELWEIQMPARADDSLLIENDTAAVNYWAGLYYRDGQFQMWMDPNPLFGRIAYTYAGGVDRPITLTRVKMVRRPQNEGFTYWSPIVLAPHWNWRGQADFGTFGDGGVKSCTDAAHCVRNLWRQIAYAVSITPENLGLFADGSHTGWFGTLVSSKENGTGTQYRRNRYVDPTTGRFTQEDPIGLAGGLNLYGFAGGDAVNFADPFGLCERTKDDPNSDTLETVTVKQCSTENPTTETRKMCVDQSRSGSAQEVFNLAAGSNIPVTMNNAYRDRVTAGTGGRPGGSAHSLHRAGLAFDINSSALSERQLADFTSIAQEYGFFSRSDDPGHFEVQDRAATNAEVTEADRSYKAGECTDANVEATKSKDQ